MKNRLTKRQIAKYINGGWECCPYCGSGNIFQTTDPEIGRNLVHCAQGCSDCDKEWMDIYTLTHIEELGDEDNEMPKMWETDE